MRPALLCSMALGLVAGVSGCRSDTGHNSGQGYTKPGGSNPSVPQAPRAEELKSEPPAIGGGPAAPGKRNTPSAPAGAVAGIAAAECDRQVRCNKIGPNETYKTRGECVSKTEHDKTEGINPKACPHGINEANLNRCIQAIRNEGCGSPTGALERLEACKTDGMCMKK